jgi:antitoxin ParD1/3/4
VATAHTLGREQSLRNLVLHCAGSTDAANRVEEAIYDACRLLARSPHAGQVRPDLTQRALRFWTVNPFKNYVVIYDPDTRPLRILRILHGARNIRELLKHLQ